MRNANVHSIHISSDGPDSYRAEFTAVPHSGHQWIKIGQVVFFFGGPEDFEVFATTMQIALKAGAEHFCGRLHADGDKEENDL